MQSRGEHNPRDFDKLIWNLPIPLFDPETPHNTARGPGRQGRGHAAQTDVSAHRTFQAQRRLIREALERDGLAGAIDQLVMNLLAD